MKTRNTRKAKARRPNNTTNDYTTKVPYIFGFIKPREVATLHYMDIFYDSLAAGAASIYTFRSNSIFDPDFTGTGHQPYGHDTLVALYNRYRVINLSWKITFPSTGLPITCCIIPSNGAISGANKNDFLLACELPYSEYKTVGHSGSPPAVFQKKVSLAMLNGAKQLEYMTDDRFGSLTGANPAELMYLNILCYNPTLTPTNPIYNVELFYEVEVFDLINQVLS
jgi:hypothetical protein